MIYANSTDVDAWSGQIGHSITYEYYTAGVIVAENPSGDKNIKKINRYNGTVLMSVTTLTYDSDSDVISLTTSQI